MAYLLPIAVTILKHGDRYLFLKRRKAPYEGLWALVGGKVICGEHVHSAAIREVLEETGAPRVMNYDFRGLVSERLVDEAGTLLAHFLIFVGYAELEKYESDNREGELAAFAAEDVEESVAPFLPSDLYMFKSFVSPLNHDVMYEAELVRHRSGYRLTYYRTAGT